MSEKRIDELPHEKFSSGLANMEHALQAMGLDGDAQEKFTEALVDFEDWHELINDFLAEVRQTREHYEFIKAAIVSAGATDFHTGKQDLPTRLDMIEACISLVHQAHRGHTNYDPTEYRAWHPHLPLEFIGKSPMFEDGMQNLPQAVLLDKITTDETRAIGLTPDEKRSDIGKSDPTLLNALRLADYLAQMVERILSRDAPSTEEFEVCEFIAELVARAAGMKAVMEK